MKNNNQLNTFYSNFKQYSLNHLPKTSINKFMPVLKKSVSSLADRDNTEMLEVRKLVGTEKINLTLSSRNAFLLDFNWNENDKSYSLGVVGPNWLRGWGALTKDESIYETISWFYHFATQYVIRGRAAEVLGATLLSYGSSYGYIESPQISQLVVPRCTKLAFDKHNSYTGSNSTPPSCRDSISSKEKQFQAWYSKINGLDPFVQRTVYYYSRFCDLRNSGHFDESITALDKVIDISYKFLLDRSVNCDRSNFSKSYNLDKSTQKWIDQVYEVRSMFGGHPSTSKWWDSEELYGDWLDDSLYMVKRLLMAMFQFENDNQTTERDPDKWSQWFLENCHMLFDSVWFHKLPF